MSAFLTLLKLSNLLDSEHPLDAFVSNLRVTAINLRGGRPAWSTAVGLGPIPYRFAGSNPAPRTTSIWYRVSKYLNLISGLFCFA